MWVIILIVVIVIYVAFKVRATSRKKAILKYVRDKGGFENMYPEIIQWLKDDIKGEIVSKTEYSVTISNQLYEVGETKYFFEQLYGGGLLIRYDKEPNKIFNEKAIRKIWTFADNADIQKIKSKIRLDLGMATFNEFLKR